MVSHDTGSNPVLTTIFQIKNKIMGIKSIDEIKNETLVQYIDVCKETWDGIVADNDNHESFISELREGLEPKDKLFTKRDSILCPSWCFEPNTLNDLKDMGYLIEDNNLWTITQKGYKFACSASFHSENGKYIIKIHDENIVRQFFKDFINYFLK